VLYADDMKQLRDLISIVLTREQYVIETVSDGQEAIERLAADPSGYDLLITDHHMPRLDGLGLVTRARALPFTGKIVVFSSELGPAVNARYRELGADLILPKPIFPETLRTALRQLFAPVGTGPAEPGAPIVGGLKP
jgi:CheY-like chemotaxis protein